MKLLKPAVANLEPVMMEIGGYHPSFFARMMGMKRIVGQMVPNPNFGNGRIIISNAIIDFESSYFNPMEKYHTPIVFGNHLYEGITAVRHSHGNVFEVAVDCVRLIELYPAYEHPEEMR